MTKEIALVNFNEEQIKLIKTQIAPEATENELGLFLYQAKRTGLDPLTRQLYCIHRSTKDARGNWVKKMTIQTSIDGFRVIAERSGDYGGQDEPIFNEQDGKLISCKITVYRFRGEVRYPAAVGVAYWSEYCQESSPMWKKMPHTMLAKVAEALALRKAYPQDLSGLYTGDEMAQTEVAEELKPVNKSRILQGLVEQAVENLTTGYNEKKSLDGEAIVAHLEEQLKGMGSVAEIEGYLQTKGQKKKKTPQQVIDELNDVWKKEAQRIILNAKLRIDPEYKEQMSEDEPDGLSATHLQQKGIL